MMLCFSFTRYFEVAVKEGFVCSGSSFKHFKQPQRKVKQIKLCLGPGRSLVYDNEGAYSMLCVSSDFSTIVQVLLL